MFFDLYRQRRQIQIQRDELKAYASTLRTIDRHKNEFIAMLGHELRNPIMAFSAGLRLLERPDTQDKAEEIRGQMRTQVFNLSRLIEDLLDISRIGQGKISLRKERIDLITVVKSAVETSQSHIEAAKHSLAVAVPPGPIWLDADSTRIVQVISNLLTNAAKYTPTGGKVELSVHPAGEVVEIVVSDNGIGIPEEMHARIFDIFTQVPGHGSRSQDGLGVGLALVKQLVEMHGGGIAVESHGAGSGSRFRVRLPVAD